VRGRIQHSRFALAPRLNGIRRRRRIEVGNEVRTACAFGERTRQVSIFIDAVFDQAIE